MSTTTAAARTTRTTKNFKNYQELLKPSRNTNNYQQLQELPRTKNYISHEKNYKCILNVYEKHKMINLPIEIPL